MKYNLEQAMELTGAVDQEQFLDAFKDKTPEEINEILIYMFGEEGNDIEFAEEIAILAKDNRLKVLYDGKIVGYITTNRNLTIDEALKLVEIDPNEMEGGDPKYDFELFELER